MTNLQRGHEEESDMLFCATNVLILARVSSRLVSSLPAPADPFSYPTPVRLRCFFFLQIENQSPLILYTERVRVNNMDLLWTVVEFILLPALVVILGFFVGIFLEAFKRRRSNYGANEVQPFFEDPNSLKQVPCPSIFDPAQKYISLIIPAFNEEHRLPGALDETMNYLQQRMAKDKSFSYEVLIVDDGSADGTNKVAFDCVRKYSIDCVRVILLGRNHGKGEAIRRGMLHARGELLLMLDADGATKVTDLEKLESQIRAVAEKELHLGDAVPRDSTSRISDVPIVAFGSRAHLEEKALATRKWYRNLLMKGFHVVVILTAGSGIRDTQCGFKMFSRAAARKLFTNIHLKRWCFDVELVYLCKHLAIPIIEISVNWGACPHVSGI